MAREFVRQPLRQRRRHQQQLAALNTPEDHLVWTVLGAVDQMNLDRFRAAYRLGAAGRAPYDPAVVA
jgi:hypothetical protein